MQPLGALKSWYLEPFAAPSVWERQRMRYLGVCIFAGQVAASAYGALYFAWGKPVLGLVYLGLFAALFGVPPLARFTRSLDLPCTLTLSLAFGLIGCSTFFSGGIALMGWVWLFTPTLLSGLLLGTRALFAFAAATWLYLTLQIFTPGGWFVPPPPISDVRSLNVSDISLFTAMLVTAVHALSRTRELAKSEADRAYKELAAENAVRKVAEGVAREAEQEARRAAKAKAEFLAVMSHELRTPMNGVLGMAELLQDERMGPEAKENLQTLNSCARSLLVIVDDILDLSKLEAGKLVLDPQAADVASLIEEVLSVVEHGRGKPEVSLCYEGERPLPFVVDPTRVRQVLMNLVGNAAKFTERGAVTVSARRASSTLVLEVEDTGIGIPENRLESLFRPFVQVEASTTRRFGGTGLGLTICQQLVRAMGGEVSVESVLGVGTTFTVRIPELSLPESVVDGTAKTSLDRPDGIVLVVDDNAVNRKVACKMLARMALTVEAVDGGEAAVSRVRQGGVSVVLMDVQMPEVDGFEATRRIREEQAWLPHSPPAIVALSANVLPDDIARARQVGMDDYLTKPVERKTLARLLGVQASS